MGNCPEAYDCLDAPDQITSICYRSDEVCGLCAHWAPVEVSEDVGLMGKCGQTKEEDQILCDNPACKSYTERGS